MGCGSSNSVGSGNRTVGESHVSRSEFYDNHPGLHNIGADRIESEVSTLVRSPDPNDNVAIKIQQVDLNVKQNTRDHKTNEYDIAEVKNLLVIRRGQPFLLDIEFNRAYDSKKDDLRIVFRFGENPAAFKPTHVEFILSEKDEVGKWGASIKSQTGSRVTLSVRSPPTCFVGKWSLNIDVVKSDSNERAVYRNKHPDEIYILFNPWCKADTVYMHETDRLFEYVLNDSGQIYAGNYKRISAKPWAFGQFEGNVLDCALYLLDERSNLPDIARGNPIAIVRWISALVNAPDDGGVLVGNWKGKYDGGTSPLDWVGSIAILEEYYETKRPVKYGQCWVFSGLVTTLCRTLGIPARSVTNFSSAHDTDSSITIDTFVNAATNEVDKNRTRDSIWNFHVWNDVWMARPDLPPGYGGWQAIDATPQETSAGIYCMGPMSLQAIKNGDVYLPYDGQFVFAEVNADRMYWLVKENHQIDFKKIIRDRVGLFMSTKAVQKRDREDVTNEYKHKEGSDEERAAVARANLSGSNPGFYITGPEDVEIELLTQSDTFMGDNIVVELKLSNKSGEDRLINGQLVVASMYYTGVHHKDIMKHKFDDEILKPNESKVIPIEMDDRKYLQYLMDHCMLMVSTTCIVQQTKQTFFEIEDLRLRKPHLTIKAPTNVRVNDRVEVEVTFKNPLSVSLTMCELRIEGPGLLKPLLLNRYSDVGSGQDFVGTFSLDPKKPGTREISVSFNSEQIKSVNSSTEIIVG